MKMNATMMSLNQFGQLVNFCKKPEAYIYEFLINVFTGSIYRGNIWC